MEDDDMQSLIDSVLFHSEPHPTVPPSGSHHASPTAFGEAHNGGHGGPSADSAGQFANDHFRPARHVHNWTALLSNTNADPYCVSPLFRFPKKYVAFSVGAVRARRTESDDAEPAEDDADVSWPQLDGEFFVCSETYAPFKSAFDKFMFIFMLKTQMVRCGVRVFTATAHVFSWTPSAGVSCANLHLSTLCASSHRVASTFACSYESCGVPT
jgi:hypothetical protein